MMYVYWEYPEILKQLELLIQNDYLAEVVWTLKRATPVPQL